MPKTIYKFFMVLGFLSLFHSAYSAAHYRQILRNANQEFYSLPIDILVQGFASLLLVMVCILQTGGDFKEIRASVDMGAKSWETLRNIPSFYTFNHRGKALAPNYLGADEDADELE